MGSKPEASATAFSSLPREGRTCSRGSPRRFLRTPKADCSLARGDFLKIGDLIVCIPKALQASLSSTSQVPSSQQNALCHGHGVSSYLKREFAVQGNHELANRGSII